VFQIIDLKEFEACFVAWTQSVFKLTAGELVGIDGKTLRGSKGNGKKAIHMVSAWAGGCGVVLGQTKGDEKSNEITAIPELLDILNLRGCIVSIDAMGCQKAIAEKIVNKEADYVLALKGNQGALHSAVVEYFENSGGQAFRKPVQTFF